MKKIVDDEPRFSISDVSKSEGRRNKTTLFTFTVTLSAAYDRAVTMSFRTVNGSAMTSDGDYISKTGTLTFAPGEPTKTITIEVKGDSKKEANETLHLDLFGLGSNALFTKIRGLSLFLARDPHQSITQIEIVAKQRIHSIQITEVVNGLLRGTQIGAFGDCSLAEVHLQVGHGGAWALAIDAEFEALPTLEIANMVVVEHVEDNVLGWRLLFLTQHPQIGLIYRIGADAIIAKGLAQVRGQCLLPGFTVADLLAAGVAVAIRIDPASLAGVCEHLPRLVLVVPIPAHRPIQTFLIIPVGMEIAQFGVVLGEWIRLPLEPQIDILAS